MDWQSEALETDSFADVVTSGGGEEAFDFDRLEYARGLARRAFAGPASWRRGRRRGPRADHRRDARRDRLSDRSAGADRRADRRPVALVEQALALVQELDPPGVGARSLAECLALQARAADRYDPAMARLIDNLDLLAKGRTADLKRICGVDDEDLADMIRELRAYDPKPGCQFSSQAPAEVTPDVFVRRTRGGFAVELNQATLPRCWSTGAIIRN